MAEGSFLIKKNNDACFQLRQREHTNLFLAFNLIFESSRKIGLDINKLGNYNLFSISSKQDIQKVINFFSFSGYHPLFGLKLIQYEN
jgi:hypothetical protein